MPGRDLKQAYLKATFDYLPKTGRLLAFLGGASSNLRIPTRSLRKKDGKDRHRASGTLTYEKPLTEGADSRGDRGWRH
jgi:hypothetical protein